MSVIHNVLQSECAPIESEQIKLLTLVYPKLHKIYVLVWQAMILYHIHILCSNTYAP